MKGKKLIPIDAEITKVDKKKKIEYLNRCNKMINSYIEGKKK